MKHIGLYKKLLILIIFLPTLVHGWNANCHKVIGQIAYSRLSQPAKQMVDKLTKVLDEKYPPQARFLYGSIWPDLLTADGVLTCAGWHFINYPYSPDGTALQPYSKENVVWAINQSEHVLLSSKANTYEKAIFLRFLLHFVGDAHQPLHCITRYTRDMPNGDYGGNLLSIKDKAKNLHAYWDQGLGMMRKYNKNLAAKITQKYPPNYFGDKAKDLNPEHWAQESFKISKNFVYNIGVNTKPSSAYNKKGREIVIQRLALAAYRLANLLNYIADHYQGM